MHSRCLCGCMRRRRTVCICCRSSTACIQASASFPRRPSTGGTCGMGRVWPRRQRSRGMLRRCLARSGSWMCGAPSRWAAATRCRTRPRRAQRCRRTRRCSRWPDRAWQAAWRSSACTRRRLSCCARCLCSAMGGRARTMPTFAVWTDSRGKKRISSFSAACAATVTARWVSWVINAA